MTPPLVRISFTFVALTAFVTMAACGVQEPSPKTASTPIPSASTPIASPAALPPLDLDDVHVAVPLDMPSSCVAVGGASLSLPSCDLDEGAQRAFHASGGIVMLVSRKTESAFFARLRAGFYAVTVPEAFRAGLSEALTAGLDRKPVPDESKSGAMVLADGTPAYRLTFDLDGDDTPGEMTHFATVSVGGRAGFYSLVVMTTRQRARDADESFSRVIATITHYDATPGDASDTSVIESQRPRVLRCFAAGLAKGGSARATLEVRVEIAPDGKVARATKVSGEGLARNVEECALAQYRAARFRPRAEPFSFAFPLRFDAPQ